MTANLTTAQKAELHVAQGGVPVTSSYSVSADPQGVVHLLTENDAQNQPHLMVYGDSAGVVTLTATHGTASGSIVVTVAEAPLELTLDAPVPR